MAPRNLRVNMNQKYALEPDITVGTALTNGADEPHITRLTALVARQREEILRLHVAAGARSVVDLARGVLMERLDCSAAEAARELNRIAVEAGTAPAELAAEIAGQQTDRQQVAGQLPAQDDQLPPFAPSVPLAAAASALAPDATALARALLSETLGDAGAAVAAIWLTAPDGATELVGQAGLPTVEASRWRRIPPGVDVPVGRATRGGATWWPAGPPAADRSPLVGPWPAGARCVVPIRPDGRTLGALEVCWRHPVAEFSAPLRQQIIALADLCGQALGSRLSGSLIGPDDRASIGARAEISATGTVYWTDSTYELFGVRSGSPVRLTELEQHVVPADVPTAAAFRARLLGDKAVALAAFQVVGQDDASIRQVRAFAEPVLGRDGEVVAVRGAYQDVSARYHAEIALAVTRDQLSGSEQRVAEEHQLALQLQEAITPHSSSQLVEAAGLAVAARYLLNAGMARQFRQPRGLLLGADPEASYEEDTTQLRAGDRLVLFTDGVIERRDQAIDDSLRELLEIAGKPTADVDELADAIQAAAASDTGDDACLLAVSVR